MCHRPTVRAWGPSYCILEYLDGGLEYVEVCGEGREHSRKYSLTYLLYLPSWLELHVE